jgi:FkbM family methyltransferase
LKIFFQANESDPLFVDVGANIGWFSFNLAAKGIRTIAFEAMHLNSLLIRSTMCANGEMLNRMTLINTGLSNTKSKCYIGSIANNLGDRTVLCNASNSSSNYIIRETIHLDKIDEYLSERIYLLKMDVEGYEMKVLQGAKQLLQNN